MTTKERLELLIARLRDPDQKRHARIRTLESTIQALFDRALNPDVMDKAIALLIREGIIEVSDVGTVEYPGPRRLRKDGTLT